MSEPMTGYGTIFRAETSAGSGTFYTFQRVTNLTPPSEEIDVIDVTHMSSLDATREFIMGLMNPGEVSIGTHFIPGTNPASNDDAFVRAWRSARQKRTCQIEFPNGIVWEFDCFPIGWEPEVPLDDVMTAQLSCKVTATVTAS
jgi:hypothetical protein